MQVYSYEMEVLVGDLMRQLEDLSYRFFQIEDEIANLTAYIEENKEEV
jgi:hypothetical protein